METFSGVAEESTEDIARRKKSKLKFLKTRLFGRSKRTVGDGNSKLSQSASDITAGKDLGSDEDLACPQGAMGSRALSHDSIFLADQILTDAEPVKVLSQDNVNSKIKALQMKLQQQKMHLGPPPLVLPVRRPEEVDGSPSHSPPEILGGDVTSQGSFSKISSFPLSSTPKPVPIKSVPLTPYLPLPLPLPSNSSSSVVEPPLDFSSPAQFTPCLDTSAARHRMSVKPKNQRASTKKKLAATDSSSYSHTLNNVDHPESVQEEEQQIDVQDEMKLETENKKPDNHPEVTPIPPETAAKSSLPSQQDKSSTLLSQQDNAPPGTGPFVSSQVLRVKTKKPTDIRQRPHSSFIESEVKDKREGGVEMQLLTHDKKTVLIKTEITEDLLDLSSTPTSSSAFRPSSIHQRVRGEVESTRGIKRPVLGSGSFHFSINTGKSRDGERPRSGSFVEVLDQAEVRNNVTKRTENKAFSSMKEKEELRDLQPKGFALTRPKQEASPPKSSVILQEKRDSSKTTESVTTSKNVAAHTEAVVEEVVEEAVEAQQIQEVEGKTKFGIKLRPTSQSLKFRSETSANRHSKPPVSEEQGDNEKRQEIGDATCMFKLPTNASSASLTSADIQLHNTTPSGSSFPLKTSPSCTSDSHITPTEVQTTSSNPKRLETANAGSQEPQPTPSSEVSWMSLAMEKTRSLQQLFTSRFPRDFTAIQSAGRPQAQVQTVNQTEPAAQMQRETVKSTTPAQTSNQPSTDTVKTEILQSPTQSVKPAQMVAQQSTSITSTTSTGIFSGDSQTKQTSEPPQSASLHVVQAGLRPTMSPLHSSKQAETSSTFVQGCANQSLAQSSLSSGQHDTSLGSDRSLQRTNQLKPSTSVSVSSTTAQSPVEKQDKESSSLSRRRAVWGSVSERAAFLEKQAEWTSPPGTKGVDLKKLQTEVQEPGDTPASSKTTSLIKATKPDGREWLKPAESSPVKVPDRSREDKWPRKNVTSSSPSSSPTQSMSESSQPSWMELAKRKSMAWSDKTMD